MIPPATTNRRILLIYPSFPPGHLVSYEHMVPFYPDRRAVMPSLGLLTIAGYLPDTWDLHLIDENVTQLRDKDIRQADAIFISGMHPQRLQIERLLERANKMGKLTVLGGPSATICPEYYPQADILHIGEIGDATGALFEYLLASPEKPQTQLRFTTRIKTPMGEQPFPAIHLINPHHYLVLPLQFSVGCPYKCEFCDIPIIYGQRPRTKSPERVLQEMQAIYDAGFVGNILFVDDNLVAKRNALKRLLPELVAWQKQHNYAFSLSAEASVDLAAEPEILQGMQSARFTHVFFGVESVDNEVLLSVSKSHNTRVPLLEAIRTIQSYGIEVLMGIIFGFDGDDKTTGTRVAKFIEKTCATMIYFNLLSALPKTPLWSRLESEKRLLASESGDTARCDELLTCLTTNVRYRMTNEDVVRMLLDTIQSVYAPEAIYQRISWNAAHVYGKQKKGIPPTSTWDQKRYILRFTLGTIYRVFWKAGIRSCNRVHFWLFLSTLIRLRLEGKIKSILEILLRDTPHAEHLIQWGRNTLRGHRTNRALVSPPK